MENKINNEELVNEQLNQENTEVCEEAEVAEACANAEACADIKEEYYELSGLTAAQRKRQAIFDKITTGILILLMASPFIILVYLFLWFIVK